MCIQGYPIKLKYTTYALPVALRGLRAVQSLAPPRVPRTLPGRPDQAEQRCVALDNLDEPTTAKSRTGIGLVRLFCVVAPLWTWAGTRRAGTLCQPMRNELPLRFGLVDPDLTVPGLERRRWDCGSYPCVGLRTGPAGLTRWLDPNEQERRWRTWNC